MKSLAGDSGLFPDLGREYPTEVAIRDGWPTWGLPYFAIGWPGAVPAK
jgi:hypothetical protein